MLDNLLFSINTVAPIFVIVALGYILKLKKFLPDEFYSASEKFVFNIALPCMLFLEVSKANLNIAEDGKFILFGSVGIIISVVLLWLIVPRFVKENGARGAFIQGAYRSNFSILAVPLIHNMCGDEGEAKIFIIMPFVIILFNVFAVTVLTYYSPREGKPDKRAIAKQILHSIITNPLIISVVAAIPFVVLREFAPSFEIPQIITKSLTYLSNTSFALALLSLGANLSISTMKKNLKLTVGATLIKTFVLPAVFVTAAALLGYRGAYLGTLFVLFASPSAVSSYIMAKYLKNDYELSGQILLFTTLNSVVTLFIGVFLLKSFNLL